MSDSELNLLDLKKILEAQELYKPGMSTIEMKQKLYLFKCKQAITAEGLYENGMSDQDIADIYNTLKKSEESAGDDKEYRDLLNRTDTNCANIDSLMEESDETVDVISIQPVSPKPQSSSKMFSFLKKRPKQPSLKNINVFMSMGEHKVSKLKLRNVKHSEASLLYYHQPKILKLPLEQRAAAISEYLLNLPYYKRDTNFKEKWSSPILPQQKKPFNGDLCIDFIPDIPEEVEEEIVDHFKISKPESPVVDSFVNARSKRIMKRKNYAQAISDDEDDILITKKTKVIEPPWNNENSPEWITRKKKALTPKQPLTYQTGGDRISKIFDKLKWEDKQSPKSEKSVVQHLQETLNLSDSDEECFPTNDLLTTANVHKEEQQQSTKNKNAKTVKAKKASPKKRGPYNKLSLQKSSATKENESPEIPTENFYANNKNSDVDESNNNKLETNDDMTNCPICNQPFSASRIEVHASTCTQYEEEDGKTLCPICNKHISAKKYESHRYECLRKITEDSIVANKPVTRSKATGFLCEICDSYITNTSEIQHASSCIAKV